MLNIIDCALADDEMGEQEKQLLNINAKIFHIDDNFS